MTVKQLKEAIAIAIGTFNESNECVINEIVYEPVTECVGLKEVVIAHSVKLTIK